MKKTTKKNVKVENKAKKELVVNLYDVNDIDDLYFNFALGKCNAGIAITDTEFTAIYSRGCSDAYKFVLEMVDFVTLLNQTLDKAISIEEEKEKPWYKKFWNKIANVFKKK